MKVAGKANLDDVSRRGNWKKIQGSNIFLARERKEEEEEEKEAFTSAPSSQSRVANFSRKQYAKFQEKASQFSTRNK